MMRKLLTEFFADVRGVTSIEYAIIAGSLSIVIVIAVDQVGSDVSNLFVQVSNAFN